MTNEFIFGRFKFMKRKSETFFWQKCEDYSNDIDRFFFAIEFPINFQFDFHIENSLAN